MNITVQEPVQEAILPTTVQPTKRGRGRPRKYPIAVFLQEDEQYQYEDSRHKEVVGLLEKGVFEVAHDVPDDARIFKARFVDEVKNKDTNKAYEKSRLVVQAYNDDEKSLVLTQSPTIQRVSQRIILCITPMINSNASLYLQDISQAYVQSTTLLNRDFYIRPPIELL